MCIFDALSKIQSFTGLSKKIIFHIILFVAPCSCLISILDFCTVQSWNGQKVRNHLPRLYARHYFHVKTFKQCKASCSSLFLFNLTFNTCALKLTFILFSCKQLIECLYNITVFRIQNHLIGHQRVLISLHYYFLLVVLYFAV